MSNVLVSLVDTLKDVSLVGIPNKLYARFSPELHDYMYGVATEYCAGENDWREFYGDFTQRIYGLRKAQRKPKAGEVWLFNGSPCIISGDGGHFVFCLESSQILGIEDAIIDEFVAENIVQHYYHEVLNGEDNLRGPIAM